MLCYRQRTASELVMATCINAMRAFCVCRCSPNPPRGVCTCIWRGPYTGTISTSLSCDCPCQARTTIISLGCRARVGSQLCTELAGVPAGFIRCVAQGRTHPLQLRAMLHHTPVWTEVLSLRQRQFLPMDSSALQAGHPHCGRNRNRAGVAGHRAYVMH